MRKRPTDFWLGLWTLSFIGATAVIAYFHPFPEKPKEPAKDIALRITDLNGRLRLDWDTNNEFVRRAQGATLEVDDGGVRDRYPVEPRTLRAGGLDYVRKTPEVVLKLTLFENGAPGAFAMARSIGPIVERAVVAAAPKPAPRRRVQTRGRRR
jgi:hypothetical protein